MLCLEAQGKILIIDIGLRMPEEDMPGIDFIIPNISYLKGKERDVVGAIFTHGHYDHIGAIPYLIDKLGARLPLFAAGLTRAIIIRRQEDFPRLPKLNITQIQDGDRIRLGSFDIEFFRQNHNISDSLGLLSIRPLETLCALPILSLI